MAQAENPLVRELREVINRNGRENGSNTPDFLLAAYLLECLEAGESLIQHRDEWYSIHPAPGWRSADERDSLAAERERAAWTRDIARMLRESTGVAPELRPGYLAAANWLDPAPGDGTPPQLPKEKDPAQRALMVRLEEQKSAIIAAREIFRMMEPVDDPGMVWAHGTALTAAIEQWTARFGALADPPAVVEVEEDDDEGDDVPHDSPEAGRSSGRWRPLMTDDGERFRSPEDDDKPLPPLSKSPPEAESLAGAAHLDFAEDAARRAREASDG